MSLRGEKIASKDLPPVPPGFRVAYAKSVLDHYLRERHAHYHHADHLEPLTPFHVPPVDEVPDKRADLGDKGPKRICIIGAGVTGLVMGLLMKLCGYYDFDILESSERVGGRVYTHEFEEDPNCPHNYYDVGAMRIPDIDTMQSTLQLINFLDLEDKKVKYVYKNDDVPDLWWYKNQAPSSQKFTDLMAQEITAFMQANNFDNAFKDFIAQGKDYYSTRGWLMHKADPPFTYEETLEAEASDTSTGLFDQSFTETICDYVDFAGAETKDWYRLEGGMKVLTDRLQERLATAGWPYEDSPAIKVTTKTPVVALKDLGDTIAVTTKPTGSEKTTISEYFSVFCTTPMAPLQRMDLQGLNLPDDVLTAIRALSYDRSTKVAIKFRTPWWKFVGGVSSTDLPISNVVYPSWDDGDDKPAVLMVSYSWAQDATRMGALVHDYKLKKPSRDETLVDVCLDSLVKLFAAKDPSITREFLDEQYITHHAHAWTHDPHTGGAFALFGPGQFSGLYPRMQEVFCKGKFAMAGEALSSHHAWISGSINSGYLTLWTWLEYHLLLKQQARLKSSDFAGGPGRHPDEMDETLFHWAGRLSKGAHKKL